MTYDEKWQKGWQALPIISFIIGIIITISCIVNSSAKSPLYITPQWKEGTVLSLDKTKNIMQLSVNKTSTDNNTEIITYSVSQGANTLLSTLGPNDIVSFNVETSKDTKDSNNSITQLAVKRLEIGYWQAIGAMLLSFSVIWAAILLVTGSHPWAFALGLDLRLSNSQTQIFLWFLVLGTVYLAELGLRFGYTHYFGGITVPQNLVALAGVSALTFGAARANTAAKVALAHPLTGAENHPVATENHPVATENRRALGRSRSGPLARWAAGTYVTTKLRPAPRQRLEHFLDLFRNDHGKIDLGDFQMIALTAVAILVYVWITVDFLSNLPFQGQVNLPPVDDTLLGGTATSQGAYLAKKIGSGLGN